jgi:CubicO group peptidase (beta-lactamase class C family)
MVEGYGPDMAHLPDTTDPADVDLDADRLERIPEHFRRYVDDGRLPGWQLMVARRGKVALHETYGQRDLEAGLPVEDDTIFRVYSMTKPIVTVTAMTLHEEGAFQLKDPVAAFIPSFGDQRVYTGGSALAPATEPVRSPMKLWHLMSHTSGLTYGFINAHPVDAMYRAAGFDVGVRPDLDLAEICDVIAGFPLVFQPGTEWNYSMSTDVLGRVIEVVTGQPLDEVVRERVLEPLGMSDSGFVCPEADHGRLAALYQAAPGTLAPTRIDALGDVALTKPKFLSGGGGMVSTVADYHRFATMLVRGGELDGQRILGPRTLAYMASNHLPGNADLEAIGRRIFAETAFDGVGFGLGFSVVIDPVGAKVPHSVGTFAWGGLASTAFWIDPVEEITAIFMTQLVPSSTHPIRPEFAQLVNQAILR